jgi:predicted GNAT family acetyltransferase
MMHPLDTPVWSSLTTHQKALADGNELARRYRPDVNLFAAAGNDTPSAQAALTALVEPRQHIYLAQAGELVVPDGFDEIKAARCVQMLAADLAPAASADGIVMLNDEDAADMLALARLTEPGPFLSRTHTMGRFLGIRMQGMLAAMAGERMHLPGYTEISGVCTHPQFRGLGLARRLSAAVMQRIGQRGERAFLHAWETNHAAIALYQSLGFTVRTGINVAVLERRGDSPG